MTSFTESFPRDEALDALVDAFERGDYARVHRDGGRLVADPKAAAEVKAAAAELLARTKPDPLSIVFFALPAALLAVLSLYWWWKAGGLRP